MKGPLLIMEAIGSNAFHLSYPNGTNFPFTYNGKDLKFIKL